MRESVFCLISVMVLYARGLKIWMGWFVRLTVCWTRAAGESDGSLRLTGNLYILIAKVYVFRVFKAPTEYKLHSWYGKEKDV